MDKQTGVAIIGCGYWGMNYVRMFTEIPNARGVVACDQDPNRLREVARRFPSVATTTDMREAAEWKGVEAAVVCTPPTTHYRVARQLLEAGRHLLVEKPMTTSSTESAELASFARSRGVVLMVGHTFIHNGGIKKLKSYLDEGQIGLPYYLYSRRTNMGPIRRDVNALWDLAPHDVAIFNHLLNSVPEWVSAVGAKVLRNHREDVGFISLGYPGGIVGHIHVSWADPNKVRELVVVGSDRRLVFDDLNSLERVRVFEKGIKSTLDDASNFGEQHLDMRDGDIISPKVDMTEPLKSQCSHFLECIASGQEPITNGRSGLEVVLVMEAVDRSVDRHGAPETVDQALLGELPRASMPAEVSSAAVVRGDPASLPTSKRNGTNHEAGRAVLDAIQHRLVDGPPSGGSEQAA